MRSASAANQTIAAADMKPVRIVGIPRAVKQRVSINAFHKDVAMLRILTILALGVLCILSEESSASEFSSRQRCECTTGHRSTSVVRYRHYGIRSAYLIGYDPLPYRFGSTFVWEPPYRYHRH